MLFNELYSAYYNTVAALLKQAMDHPLSDSELSEIIHQHAFEESELYIRPALKDQRWQLIQTEGTTCLKKIPSMPLTTLQKQWLKAIGMDVLCVCLRRILLIFLMLSPCLFLMIF